MANLIKPLEIEVKDIDGNLHKYTISRLPAVAGREILAKYLGGTMPKVGDYKDNHESMLKMMKYVAVEIDGQLQTLQTQALIDNHIPDTECLLRLEIEMIRHNTSFFGNAGSSNLLDFLLQKIKASIPSNFKTQIVSLLQSLQKN
ncbi:hypothetical protein QUR76_06920 [Arcobacter cryaerophilus gv. pseudocryaerophilus]|uniref:Uncharacterized protein n=3 Tax=unclassified Arcobacter TaxID=2593671 RepID=A0AA96DIF6_9BACT|nr:hypothetical protein RMQ65_01175 [Arcobacter sp. AZ-2023]WPD04858.1 hypothetical protein QUR76_06920 [Arcobacter sp. DSM 115956]WPD06953.1 hypothetical protein QUR78_06920 [Arcobacter sp. DSM 115955]WNL31218.1 hypothetical protein RMQ67_06920 [Arcobacter sp. AZ-2023]WNP37368.1 hypothetical protein RJG58_06920 [Arcobacter sp. AZ-2023]